MKIVIFAYSRRGCETARKTATFFGDNDVRLYTVEKFMEPGFRLISKPSGLLYGALFHQADAMIFVGSCGIAVREISPYVNSKQTDPAVLDIDELAHFVIPLLSGHIGGANDLARSLADYLGGTPVVTTATDINQKFSVDNWATRQGLTISSMLLAKAVSAEILERDLPIRCDFPVCGKYPGGTYPGEEGDLGVMISWSTEEPFHKTLRLIPSVLHLGIGCRKGTDTSTIQSAVGEVLREHHIDRRSIKCVCSIVLKAEEKGLLEFCEENGLPARFYTAEELQAVPGEFTPSEFVSQITGVDNVCERAAMVGAGRLIVRKTASNGVTVAVAAENMEVNFG